MNLVHANVTSSYSSFLTFLSLTSSSLIMVSQKEPRPVPGQPDLTRFPQVKF